MRKILKDKLLLATLISNFFYSFAYPIINYTIISHINQKIISFNMILSCIFGLIVPILWNKYSNKLYKRFGYFMFFETISYVILVGSMVAGLFTYKAYYIIETIIICLISKNVWSGLNKLKSIRYVNNEREKYDNNISMVSCFSCLLGYLLSFIFTLNIKLAFVFILIGTVSDNIFYYNIYKNKCRKIMSKKKL